jgi:osmotically inducible protein OsmC
MKPCVEPSYAHEAAIPEMKSYTRKASVTWLGTHQRGKGAIATPGAILDKIPYSSASYRKRGGTNPSELMAAAHASSFSMSLATEMATAGFCPKDIFTTASFTLEPLASRWHITQVHLDVVATVENTMQCDFVDAALRAKANCPISQLLNANISMRVKLNRRGPTRLLPHRESAVALAARPNSRPQTKPLKNKIPK